ncbi:unnamed protein product [Phytophthora fragariaefolia]|uniref:Unnamed protein product n=1 Tax=Phytophthora fragariaefolia TaxID=1490495 RepID=A0A9W7CS54_9STRA|nr:unnamed protein product [Phytophthora fragariaefolia]
MLLRPIAQDMRNFPGATQPRHQNQQIDDLGKFFFRTDISNNQYELHSMHMGEQLQEQQQLQKPTQEASTCTSSVTSSVTVADREDDTEHVTSPPLSSFADMLKDGNELEAGLGLDSLSKEPILLRHSMATPTIEAGITNEYLAAQDAMDLVNFSLGQHSLSPMAVPIAAAVQQTAQLVADVTPPQPSTPGPTAWSSDDDDFTFASEGSSSQWYSCIYHSSIFSTLN